MWNICIQIHLNPPVWPIIAIYRPYTLLLTDHPIPMHAHRDDEYISESWGYLGKDHRSIRFGCPSFGAYRAIYGSGRIYVATIYRSNFRFGSMQYRCVNLCSRDAQSNGSGFGIWLHGRLSIELSYRPIIDNKNVGETIRIEFAYSVFFSAVFYVF